MPDLLLELRSEEILPGRATAAPQARGRAMGKTACGRNSTDAGSVARTSQRRNSCPAARPQRRRREDAQWGKQHAGGTALMPDLLLELRSEEIPARMQRKAAGDLRKMVTDGLVEAGLTYEGCQEYWTPRRLTLDVRGVTARSRDVREEKKGPKVGAPQAAVDGFLRSAGLTDIAEAHIHSDAEEGRFLRRPRREARARRRGDHRRVGAGGDPCLPLAEIDALGQGRRPSRGRCAGCARCSRSSAPSGRRPRSRW